MRFRLQTQWVHLTYKGHIDPQSLIDYISLRTKREVKAKVAHETGDERHDYNHTHLLIYFTKKLDTRSERIFDYKNVINCTDITALNELISKFDNIHPHIQKVNNYDHWCRLLIYLEKENCVFDYPLKKTDYPDNTGFSKNLIEKIQAHHRWRDVLNDSSISYEIANKMKWAEAIYGAKTPYKFLDDSFTLYEWEEEALKLLMHQDDRTVLWLWEEEGGVGKTTFAKYILDNYDSIVFKGGRMADMGYAFDDESIVIFDIPRSYEQFTPYRAIEGFKDGCIFSSKYNSRMKRFKPCLVLVLANFPPDMEGTISKNRWVIREIANNSLKSLGGSYNIKENPKGRLSDDDVFVL